MAIVNGEAVGAGVWRELISGRRRAVVGQYALFVRDKMMDNRGERRGRRAGMRRNR